jgi:hypothetical protein
MRAPVENRNCNRHTADHPIVCTIFASHSSYSLFDGKMKNDCEAGMYAEIPTGFKEGTVLLVRSVGGTAAGSLQASTQEGYRSISLAEAKWSQPVSSDGAACYGTGLRHLALW